MNWVPWRRGKGAAILAGFDSLSSEILAFADADSATPADSLEAVITPVREGTVSVSVGSRRHPAATSTSHRTPIRRLLGDGFAWLARRVLAPSLYDYQCGAKALSAEAFAAIEPHLRETGFAWDLELLAVADTLGYDIREVPIRWDNDPESTVEPVRTPLRMAVALVLIRDRIRTIEQAPGDSPERRLSQSGDRSPQLAGGE